MRTAALVSLLLAVAAVDARPGHGKGVARRHHRNVAARRDMPQLVTRADGRKCKPRSKVPAKDQAAEGSQLDQQDGQNAAGGDSTTTVAPSAAYTQVPGADKAASSPAAGGDNWIGGDNNNQGNTDQAAASPTSTAEDNTATAPTKEHGYGGGLPSTGSVGGGPAKKAGVSYIAPGPAWDQLKDLLGWYSTYSATPGDGMPGPEGDGSTDPTFVAILWGEGDNPAEPSDGDRLQKFKQLAQEDNYVRFAQGFFEPDCPGYMSADMDVDSGIRLWNEIVKPMEGKGTSLISPSMCKQMAETWLQEFKEKGGDWKYTNVHINKPDGKSVRAAVDQYLDRYGKDLWISEWACVYDHTGRTCDRADDNQFCPCTDMGEIENYINGTVYLFEHHPRIAAHAFSNGDGLGDQWKLWDKWGGDLTATGRLYRNALAAARDGSLQIPSGWEEACANLN